jgi:glutamate N-acetyltransferase/amino-acid N-acetyltransferase
VTPLPIDFVAYSGRAGLRTDRDDLAMVVSRRSCQAAGLFTRSLFAGSSVTISQQRLAAGWARGVVVVASNANVATGAQGHQDALAVAEQAGRAAGIEPEEMLIASTGVIGRRYPMDRLESHLRSIDPSAFTTTIDGFARAIMTTDTVPKTAERALGESRLVGVAKGVGMIEPHLATMLAFVFTDAEMAGAELSRAWRDAVAVSFNSLSVDGDTSTSDTAVVFANGAAGPVDPELFGKQLTDLCLDLTRQLARDGEGATKLLVVTATGARDHDQARRVAKSILNSPLVKAAVHGADPNWGRVAMAIGKCEADTDIDPDRITIRFGSLELYPTPPGPAELDRLRTIMGAEEVHIGVDLGVAAGSATVYGCDLSAEYVRINADYTT